MKIEKINIVFIAASALIALMIALAIAPSAHAAASPQLSSKAFVIAPGSTYTLKLCNAKGTVTWVSSNTNTATVNSKGVVKGISKGVTGIRAIYKGKTYVCKVFVGKLIYSSSRVSVIYIKTQSNAVRLAVINRSGYFSKASLHAVALDSRNYVVNQGRSTFKKTGSVVDFLFKVTPTNVNLTHKTISFCAKTYDAKGKNPNTIKVISKYTGDAKNVQYGPGGATKLLLSNSSLVIRYKGAESPSQTFWFTNRTTNCSKVHMGAMRINGAKYENDTMPTYFAPKCSGFYVYPCSLGKDIKSISGYLYFGASKYKINKSL